MQIAAHLIAGWEREAAPKEVSKQAIDWYALTIPAALAELKAMPDDRKATLKGYVDWVEEYEAA